MTGAAWNEACQRAVELLTTQIHADHDLTRSVINDDLDPLDLVDVLVAAIVLGGAGWTLFARSTNQDPVRMWNQCAPDILRRIAP
jgi:hypothetical protein